MKYRKHQKPSDKQLKVLAILQANPSITLADAGRQAGYAESTIRNLRNNVLDKPLVKSLLDNYRYQLEQHNINPKRLANKLDRLLEASVPIVDKVTGETIGIQPNHKIQLETIKVIHDVYGVKADSKQPEGIKRRLTLEEFEEKEGLDPA